jgi:hypothetical protein
MLLRAIVAMVAGASLLAASPAGAGSLEDCGQRVLRDWYSGGRVDKVYPLPCYRAAIRALPDDVLQYTDASAAIERALESARQGTTEKTKPTPDDAQAALPAPAAAQSSAASSKATTPTTASRAAARPPVAPPHDPARLASGPAREPREPGLPYPLVALAALSLVLLVSGIAAGLAHRRR